MRLFVPLLYLAFSQEMWWFMCFRGSIINFNVTQTCVVAKSSFICTSAVVRGLRFFGSPCRCYLCCSTRQIHWGPRLIVLAIVQTYKQPDKSETFG